MEPRATLQKPRRQGRVIQVLTQEEFQRLFDVITTKRDRARFRVAYRHGLRASEVGQLSCSDADFRTGRLTIYRILKHSIATHLLDAGADLAFVQDWLGHANIQNALIYARMTTVKRDAAARRVCASQWVV